MPPTKSPQMGGSPAPPQMGGVEKPSDFSRSPCYVKNQPSGGLSVTFQIRPEDTERLKKKAYQMDLAVFLYENVIKPALSGALY